MLSFRLHKSLIKLLLSIVHLSWLLISLKILDSLLSKFLTLHSNLWTALHKTREIALVRVQTGFWSEITVGTSHLHTLLHFALCKIYIYILKQRSFKKTSQNRVCVETSQPHVCGAVSFYIWLTSLLRGIAPKKNSRRRTLFIRSRRCLLLLDRLYFEIIIRRQH